MDVSEEDVGHPRAVGERDREREERKPPLRVQASVDRIDDDAEVAALPDDLLTELLRDQRETAVEALAEDLRDGELGGRVDGGRLVAAHPRTDGRLPHDPGRKRLEDARDSGSRLAADGRVVGHSSSGERSSPLVSLGKKYVLFSGILSPASATASTWSTAPGP